MKFFNGHCSCIALLTLLVTACTSPTAISPQSQQVETPSHWTAQSDKLSNAKSYSEETLYTGWLAQFNDDRLERMIKTAFYKNYPLKSQKARVDIAKQAANISQADRFPELSLSLTGSRNKRIVADDSLFSTDTELMLQLNYEIDLWGKLSAAQKASRLQYAEQLAIYEQSQIVLAANISRAWFNLIEAKQLLQLYQQREKNLQSNLDNIQASYRLGINQALDVYLAKNDVNSELARIANQKQVIKARSRDIQLFLGDYPSGLLKTDALLPKINAPVSTGIPSDILTNRADIRSQWYALLAKDAELAVAHKQRFPRFALTAKGGDSSENLENLLNGGALAWSLLGNITAPLFNAGRLKSLQEQARLAVVQQEQQYLNSVFNAFSEVENAISNQQSLNERFRYFQKAKMNAMSAEKLSFDQYMSGLVSYATVLEAQRRSFDAQTTVIQLTNELLQNRIALSVALGGQLAERMYKSDEEERRIEDNIRQKDGI